MSEKISFDIEKLEKRISSLEKENIRLKEQTKFFTKTQELAKIGSWMLDLKSEKITFTRETYNIFEISNYNEKISIEDVLEFIHPEYKEAALKVFDESTRHVKNFDFNFKIITRKGKEKKLRIIGEFDFNKLGQSVLLSGLVLDITNSELIKTIENQFKILFENAPDGIIKLDKNGKIILANKEFAKLVKMEEEKIIGSLAGNFFDNKDYFNTQFTALKKNGYIETEDLEISKEITKSYIWSKAVALYDDHNEFSGAIAFLRDFSHHKVSENKLRNSEEQYRLLIEQAVDGIIIGNMGGEIVIVNKSASNLTGYNNNELIGKQIEDLFPTSVLKEHPLRYDLLDMGEIVVAERVIKTKKGKLIEIEMHSKLLPNGLFQSIMHDISDKKKAIKALKESEERFRHLYNNSTIGLYRTTVEGKVLMANPTLIKLLGFTTFEALQKINTQKGIYKDKNLREKIINELKLKDTVTSIETEWIKTNGRVISIRENTKAFKDHQGKIIYIEGSVEDITAEKNAKKALAESEKHFRLLFENSPLGIFTAKKDGAILNANKALLDILGSPSIEETKKINILDFKPLEDNGFTEDFIQCIKHKKVISKEYLYTSKWGKTNYLWEHLFPLMEDNEVKLVYVIIENISDRKNIENELIKAKEKAEESDRLKTSFLANMSHEIRTPMNAIVGFAELLNNAELDRFEQQQYVAIINQNTNQLLQLVNDLIDISKIEVGQIKIQMKECNINNLLDKLYESYSTELHYKPNLKLIINKTLPDHESIIKTDQTRLWQVLLNLINNAYKFTKKGYVEFGYFLPKDKNNMHIQFYIKDTGIGIDKNKFGLIFNPFRQSDESTERNYGGTGLGLSISKGLIQLLGGKIWLESELKEGTTFYFTLPYEKQKKGKNMTTENEENKTQDIYNWEGKKILIVEDNDPNYIFLREILKRTQVELERSITGKDAVHKCETEHFDLVLMDIRLPEMDGYEATRIIKTIKPELPIIAQTAYAMADDRIKCFESGCSGYFAKPVKRKELLSMINNFLEL